MIIGTEKLVTSSDCMRRLNKTHSQFYSYLTLFSSQAIFLTPVLLPFVKGTWILFLISLSFSWEMRWRSWTWSKFLALLPWTHELNYYCTEGASEVKPLCYKLAVVFPSLSLKAEHQNTPWQLVFSLLYFSLYYKSDGTPNIFTCKKVIDVDLSCF